MTPTSPLPRTLSSFLFHWDLTCEKILSFKHAKFINNTIFHILINQRHIIAVRVSNLHEITCACEPKKNDIWLKLMVQPCCGWICNCHLSSYNAGNCSSPTTAHLEGLSWYPLRNKRWFLWYLSSFAVLKGAKKLVQGSLRVSIFCYLHGNKWWQKEKEYGGSGRICLQFIS